MGTSLPNRCLDTQPDNNVVQRDLTRSHAPSLRHLFGCKLQRNRGKETMCFPIRTREKCYVRDIFLVCDRYYNDGDKEKLVINRWSKCTYLHTVFFFCLEHNGCSRITYGTLPNTIYILHGI